MTIFKHPGPLERIHLSKATKDICVRNKDMKTVLEAKFWAKLQKHWATHYSLIISFAI